MASSNADLKTRIATLRHEILSYTPGKAVSCDDERVVFPDKLVVGMISFYSYMNPYQPALVPALRRALHRDVKPSKHADKRQTSTEDQKEYLTDSISVIMRICSVNLERTVQELAGKVGSMVLLVLPSQFLCYPEWIKTIKKITGLFPLCAIFAYGDILKAINKLKQLGITDMYEIPHPDDISSDEDQLQLLDLLRGCLHEGDRTLATNELKKLCTNPRCRLLFEKTKKEAKEANQKMITEVEERKQLKKVREEEEARAEKEKCSLVAEMTKKIESKQQRVDTLTAIVGEKERNETTLTQQLQELKKEREEDRAKAEKEKHLLAADMTEKLESKQQHIDTLMETVGEKERNETTVRQQVEELRKRGERNRARFEKDKRSIKLSWKKEHDYKEQLLEQLERETWKLRTKIQLESEIRSAGQKKKAETHQWSFIDWVASGKQAQSGTSSFEDNSIVGMRRSDTLQAGEEPPDDEFAGILQRIADDLYDEAKIDSLAGQLGILHGDIQRALMTNVKFNRVTSDGTRHMLKQWRRGVSRKDERIELTKALQAAKLVNLADLYLIKGEAEEQIDAEYAHGDVNDQQLSNRDETSLEQDLTKGHTDDIQVLQEATSSSNHTPRDGHTGNMASKTQEDLTDGSRSQHLDQSQERSTEDLDESEVISEEVSSEEVHPGDDMNSRVSSIQPSEQSPSHGMPVLPEDVIEIAPLVSYGGKPNEESTTLDTSHVGGIISNEEELISQLVLIDTSPEKILLLLLLKIMMDVSQKALSL